MMRKKISFTTVTPIPSFIPRQLAIDILHSHGEIIELNPLVIGFEPIKAPRDAPADEFYSTWYEISERIQYIPGVGKLGSGKIKFKGCFHDMPWGLQTHVYAPAHVDLRNNYKVCGNQPGEPPETRELGIDAPAEGLWLREDIQITCNVTMVGFVKKETKAASKVLVERLIKKAELLDAGALHAMFENGKLKTINPADRRDLHGRPQSANTAHMSPRQGTFPQTQPLEPNEVIMELPGDFYHPQPSPTHLNPEGRYGAQSDSGKPSPDISNGRWSHASNDCQSSISSRPSSYASDGVRSPGPEQKGFATELPTMQETREEHEDSRKRLEGEPYPEDRKYKYNPQDFVNLNPQPYAQAPLYGQTGSYSHYAQHGR